MEGKVIISNRARYELGIECNIDIDVDIKEFYNELSSALEKVQSLILYADANKLIMHWRKFGSRLESGLTNSGIWLNFPESLLGVRLPEGSPAHLIRSMIRISYHTLGSKEEEVVT